MRMCVCMRAVIIVSRRDEVDAVCALSLIPSSYKLRLAALDSIEATFCLRLQFVRVRPINKGKSLKIYKI